MQASWRRTVSTGVQHGIPMPCFTTALCFYDGYRHEKLPANLLQVRHTHTVCVCVCVFHRHVFRVRPVSCASCGLCFRHRGTTLERTRTSCCPTLVSSSTPTGRVTEGQCPPPPTTLEDHVLPTPPSGRPRATRPDDTRRHGLPPTSATLIRFSSLLDVFIYHQED